MLGKELGFGAHKQMDSRGQSSLGQLDFWHLVNNGFLTFQLLHLREGWEIREECLFRFGFVLFLANLGLETSWFTDLGKSLGVNSD